MVTIPKLIKHYVIINRQIIIVNISVDDPEHISSVKLRETMSRQTYDFTVIFLVPTFRCWFLLGQGFAIRRLVVPAPRKI